MSTTSKEPSSDSETAPAAAAQATPNRLTRPYLDTPVVKTENSSRETVEHSNVKGRYRRLAEEIEPYLVGPMPVKQFLKNYLPEDGTPKGTGMPPCADAFTRVPDQLQDEDGRTLEENEVKKSLALALNQDDDRSTSLRCPGIKFIHTDDRGETRYEPRIGISGYLEGDGVGRGKGKCFPGHVQIFAELKLKDFACDKPDVANGKRFLYGHLNDQEIVDRATQALGQQVSYAIDICARQHRNFLFSIFMTVTHARFLRWDRAGVIISASFNYREDPETLCDFLWRFGHMTDAQRGCDITVIRADPAEEEIFRTAIIDHVNSQLGTDFLTLKDECARHYDENKVVKIPIRKNFIATDNNVSGQGKATEGIDADGGEHGEGKDNEEVVEFLVSRPVVNPTSLASCATRGYWVVNPQTKTVHFLKDTWRTDMANVETEGMILQELNDNKVRNVPTLVCYGDVGAIDVVFSRTRTHEHKFTSWNIHAPEEGLRLTPRVHYRQVIAEAGYTLAQMSGTRELLSGARDVYHALCDAHCKCNRLHQDISPSNIILFADPESGREYPQRRCILIDWELSCLDVPGEVRDHWMSGTWAFMSIATLQRSRNHHVCDDVESLFYVIFYCAIHCLPWTNGYSIGAHRSLIEFFDQKIHGIDMGGDLKTSNAVNGRYFKLAQFEHVSGWLEAARKLILQWMITQPGPAAQIFKKCDPIFKKEEKERENFETNNREYHERPYKSPPQDSSFSATMPSSRHLPALGGSSKRPIEAVEDVPPSESSTKRVKIDEAASNAVAGPSNARNTGRPRRKTNKASGVPSAADSRALRPRSSRFRIQTAESDFMTTFCKLGEKEGC